MTEIKPFAHVRMAGGGYCCELTSFIAGGLPDGKHALFSTPIDLSWLPKSLELAGYDHDHDLQAAFEDMLDRMLAAEERVDELEKALAEGRA